MRLSKTALAALRRDPELVPKMTKRLRRRIEEEQGPMATVVQAAEALAPVLEEAVRKRPSRLGKIGLRGAHLLAGLAAEDERSNRKLATIAAGGIVGIVFVDVAGFATFTERSGDAAARRLLSRLGQLVSKSAERSRGEVVKRLGDGFLIAFPSASQAVRGAISLRDAVAKERTGHPSFDVHLCISVHAGEPLVEGDDLLGHDVNLAARLLDHCEPDEVVVSETAKELAERRLRKIRFGPRRVVKIRGLSSKVALYGANP